MAVRVRRGDPEKLPLKRRLRREMTEPERRLWLFLSRKQLRKSKFRRQHGIGPYVVDFYCPAARLVVEIDGESHARGDRMTKDRQRDTYLRSLGVQVIRYSNIEVMTNLTGVLEDVLKRLGQDSTSPTSSLQRRGNDRSSSGAVTELQFKNLPPGPNSRGNDRPSSGAVTEAEQVDNLVERRGKEEPSPSSRLDQSSSSSPLDGPSSSSPQHEPSPSSALDRPSSKHEASPSSPL